MRGGSSTETSGLTSARPTSTGPPSTVPTSAGLTSAGLTSPERTSAGLMYPMLSSGRRSSATPTLPTAQLGDLLEQVSSDRSMPLRGQMIIVHVIEALQSVHLLAFQVG